MAFKKKYSTLTIILIVLGVLAIAGFVWKKFFAKKKLVGSVVVSPPIIAGAMGDGGFDPLNNVMPAAPGGVYYPHVIPDKDQSPPLIKYPPIVNDPMYVKPQNGFTPVQTHAQALIMATQPALRNADGTINMAPAGSYANFVQQQLNNSYDFSNVMEM